MVKRNFLIGTLEHFEAKPLPARMPIAFVAAMVFVVVAPAIFTVATLKPVVAQTSTTPPNDLQVVIEPDGTIRLFAPAEERRRASLPRRQESSERRAIPKPEVPVFSPGFETRSGAPLETVLPAPGQAGARSVNPDPSIDGPVFPQKVPLEGQGPGRPFDPNARAQAPRAPEQGPADLTGWRPGDRRELINLDEFTPAGGVRLEQGQVVLPPEEKLP